MSEHGERQHARLSPSSADRWIPCPGSIFLAESLSVQDHGSKYADDGEAAHELAEIRAAEHFGLITKRQATIRFNKWKKTRAAFAEDLEWMEEAEEHVASYVALLQSEMDRVPGSFILLEVRVDAGVPESDGTADAMIVSPVHIAIVDFKYGVGVRVEAVGNPQLRLYGAGALREYGDVLDTTKTVRCVVHQPRAGGIGHTSTEEISANQLREWVENTVRPSAEEALLPGGRLQPTEKGCRWCPVSGMCPAQMSLAFSEPMEAPEVLTPAQIAEGLQRAPLLERWLSDLRSAAFRLAYEENVGIPGYKVVQSSGQRQIFDEAGALDALAGIGFAREKVTTSKILGITALEKMLGKVDFATVLSPFVRKTEGRPSLVPDSDNRQSVNPHSEAAAMFSKEQAPGAAEA